MSHYVIYVPGLGDTNIQSRKLLIANWRLYGVKPLVHHMNWADKRPFAEKLESLLTQIDTLVAAGHTVSLVGESAGASVAINAYAARQDTIHRIACICGKLRRPETIGAGTYAHNPAFKESMALLPASLGTLSKLQLSRIRSVRPMWDPTVAVADTYINGAESYTIPSIGHPTSIVLGATIFGYTIIGFLKKR